MQKDLTTLLAERDAQQHKAELEKLREENLRLLQHVSDRIDLAKAEITDSAITKTMAVLDHTRNWILGIFTVLAFVIAAASFIGINGISNKITAIATDNVRNWLRFEDSDNDTGSHKILNDLRTKALLDSLTIRSARDNIRDTGLSYVTLTPAEKNRLMALILDPASDDAQFKDALTLVVKSRGMYGMTSEDETGKKIAAILSNADFSNDKKSYVFYAMRHERSLLPWAMTVVNDTSGQYDESFRMAAFENVSFFEDKKEMAQRFAENNLRHFRLSSNRIELAKYLIGIGEDGPLIDNLIAELKQQKNDSWGYRYQSLILDRLEWALAAVPQNTPATAKLISTQIDNGLRLEIEAFGSEKPYIRLNLETYIAALPHPENLIGNAALVDAIVKQHPVTATHLQKVSDFFQTRDRGWWITTLMMEPAAETQLKFTDGHQLSGKDVLDNIWLRVESKAGQPLLLARWRLKSGDVHEGIIAEVTDIGQAHYHIDFSQEQLSGYTRYENLNSGLF